MPGLADLDLCRGKGEIYGRHTFVLFAQAPDEGN